MKILLTKNVQKLIKQNGISVRELERECGLPYATIKDLENHLPRIDRVEKIADYFGVSIDSLVGRREETYSAEEKSLIALYRSATDEDKAVIDLVLSKYKKANVEDSAV